MNALDGQFASQSHSPIVQRVGYVLERTPASRLRRPVFRRSLGRLRAEAELVPGAGSSGARRQEHTRPLVGKWVRRGCEGAWGGKLADRLFRAAEDHAAAHCQHGLNPPQEWLARLSDPKKDDVSPLTKVDLDDDAQLAIRSAAEFVLKTGIAELLSTSV